VFDDVSGSAIWDKSPQSVMADQTMKKALIKRAVARLVAKMASSSSYCDHLARGGRLEWALKFVNLGCII